MNGRSGIASPVFAIDLEGGERMPEISHVVADGEAGRTVKSLALREMALSRSLFSSLKFRGGLLLDGQPVHADVRLSPGQVLTARWEEKCGGAPAPCPAPFAIVWEDENYYVLEKPAPLPTLASPRQGGPALESALYAHLGCPADFVFRPVNRLDKGTSGLMAAAKNAHAQQLLQRRLHTDSFRREYLALCAGAPPQAAGVIDLPIGKGPGVRREVRMDGRRAVTRYQTERTANGLSLLRLRLETGRTHQIRVHVSALSCPILGDYLYGSADPRLPGRFALHACRLSFSHPLTGERLCFDSPLPREIAALLAE